MRQCRDALRGTLFCCHLPGALTLMLMKLIGCQPKPRADDANRVAIATAVIADFLIAPAQRVLCANIGIEFRTVDDSLFGNSKALRRFVYCPHCAADQPGQLPRRPFSMKLADDLQLACRERRTVAGIALAVANG